MRYKMVVMREDGSVKTEDVEANTFQEAKENLLAEPDVIDANLAKSSSGSVANDAVSGGKMQEAIDQYVGTEQQIKDIVGEVYD